jgi:hypothetical protein
MQTYSIDNFNLDNINSGNVAIIGMRATGKTFIIKEILLQKRACKIGRIFSRTEKLNTFYGSFVDSDYIEYNFNPYLIREIIDNQMKNNKKMVIIVYDDCLSSKGEWCLNNEIIEVITKAKELNILNIFAFQFALGIPDNLKKFDQVIIMSEHMQSNRRRIFNHYINPSLFPNFETFEIFYKEIISDRMWRVMVVDNDKKNSLEDNVFSFNSKEIDDKFKIKDNYPILIEIKSILLNTCVNLPESEKSSESGKISDSEESSVLIETFDENSVSSDYYFNLLSNKKKLTNEISESNEALENIIINTKDDIIQITKNNKKIQIMF